MLEHIYILSEFDILLLSFSNSHLWGQVEAEPADKYLYNFRCFRGWCFRNFRKWKFERKETRDKFEELRIWRNFRDKGTSPSKIVPEVAWVYLLKHIYLIRIVDFVFTFVLFFFFLFLFFFLSFGIKLIDENRKNDSKIALNRQFRYILTCFLRGNFIRQYPLHSKLQLLRTIRTIHNTSFHFVHFSFFNWEKRKKKKNNRSTQYFNYPKIFRSTHLTGYNIFQQCSTIKNRN